MFTIQKLPPQSTDHLWKPGPPTVTKALYIKHLSQMQQKSDNNKIEGKEVNAFCVCQFVVLSDIILFEYAPNFYVPNTAQVVMTDL